MKFLSDILIKAGIVVEGSSTLQSLAGTGTRMVVANAAGLVSAQAIPTGNVTGSGTAGRVAIWDSASNIIGSNSLLYDTATGNLSIGGSGSSYRLNVLGVADSAIGQVITATSGRINMYPYHSATYGGLMESRNLLDTASQPITLSGSNVILLGSSATVTSLAGSGVRMVVTDASGVLSSQAIPVSSVTSVFGRTGAVTSQSGDYTTTQVTEGTNLYFTNARSRSAITLTTTGTSGASTYDSINGILNIPSYVGSVTGTGAAGQVAFWTGTSVQSGSSSLVWDNAFGRLGIGFPTPASILHIVGSISTTPVSRAVHISSTIVASANNDSLIALDISPSFTNSSFTGLDNQALRVTSTSVSATGDANGIGAAIATFRNNRTSTAFDPVYIVKFTRQNSSVASWYFGNDANNNGVLSTNNSALRVGKDFGGTYTEYMRMFSTGNFLLQNGGTFTDSGERLQVTGTAKITGATSIGAALTVAGQVTAGNAQAPNGSTIIRSTYSSGNLSNIGTNGSSGGISINYAAYNASTSTADAYLSGTGIAAYGRASYLVESDHRWLSAASALVAEGSAVTLTEKMRLYNNGNLVIQNGGTYTDSGERLQVTGTMKVTTSGMFGTNAQSAGVKLETDGVFRAWTSVQLGQFGSGTLTASSFSKSATGSDFFSFDNASGFSAINGTYYFLRLNNNISPTSGTAIFNQFLIQGTVNQTGGANGVTRGIYVNPTLTVGAVADWRSIEWSNNSGYGLYGAGTAQNLLNGKLTVNHTVLAANFTNTNTMGVFGQQLLNIPVGTQGTSGAVYAASSGFHYFRFNGNTTLVGDALWAGSIAVSNLQFDTTGTITMADGVGGGTRQRALSGMQIQMQTAGNNNGTVTRAAGLLIQGCYPSTGTGVTTFGEFAGIRINDLTEWGTARITMTDRWGIYQAGADDKNYFNGVVVLGSTSSTGERMQVNGTMKVTGAVKLSGLPTSATGLTAGDLWNDLGTVKIV